MIDREFYRQDSVSLARALVGKILVRRLPDGTELRLRITETEAYTGVDDTACHAHNGTNVAATRTVGYTTNGSTEYRTEVSSRAGAILGACATTAQQQGKHQEKEYYLSHHVFNLLRLVQSYRK